MFPIFNVALDRVEHRASQLGEGVRILVRQSPSGQERHGAVAGPGEDRRERLHEGHRLQTVVPQQYREYLRSKETCRALERDFGLRPVRNERPRFEERAPTRAEDRMARDRGLVSEKEQLKALIRGATKDGPTMSEFVRRLRAKGVQVRANIARTGHVSGSAIASIAWR